MFILTTISDLVALPPHSLYKRDMDNLSERLNSKYANHVIPRVGLCICLYDILNYSDGLVGAGTGNVNVNVEFRMIVFRPFKGEILTGVIKRCTREGLELWFDQGTVVNVRVEAEKWGQGRSGGPAVQQGADGKAAGDVSYAIEASIMESGLGGLDWW
ncbi:hypothetical protein DV735_g5416, partial [Chaetothyriales sp. CBS 134920]